MDYNEEFHQQDLQRLRGLRLIDDDFMTACFDNYIEGAQLILNIILDRNDLTVTEVRAQKVMIFFFFFRKEPDITSKFNVLILVRTGKGQDIIRA